MVFPTASYSTKINAKFEASKKFKISHPKVGPRNAPNRHDRISAYNRAFQRYIQMDSKLASWKQRMDEKGLPGPLVDDYQRSSLSWQHSLSSMSSDSSTCTNDSYTINRPKNVYGIKPTKSLTITTTVSGPTSPPPLSPPTTSPMPKSSVSRRIINRLSLSRLNSKNHHHSSKVAPTATQSLRRHSGMSSQKYEGPPVISHPLPTPSYSILHHQQQKYSSPLSSRMSLDRHLHQNQNSANHHHHHYHQPNTKRGLCHYAPTSPRLSVPSSCGIEDFLSQKRHSRYSTITAQPLMTSISSARPRSIIIH